MREYREAMPEPWPEEGRRRRTLDGTEYVTMSRMASVDPLEQSYTREMRVEKWRDGTLIAQEERTLRGQIHFRNEVELMLKLARFNKIKVHDYYTDEEATAESEEIVFVAKR